MIIFVFGSNLAGLHNGGAALHAKIHYGAIQGQGEGLQGQSYAIPTKNTFIKSMPLNHIRKYVERFLAYADSEYIKWGETNQFLVTQVGCGRAGYNAEDIAPMFAAAPANCFFAGDWGMYLT